MSPEVRETAKNDTSKEIFIGESSWDSNSSSVKYAWTDKNGKVTRGGEFPVEALPQMIRMALEHGYLNINDIFKG